MGYHSKIVAGRPPEQKQLIHASQTAALKTLSAPESPFSLCNVTDREREGGGNGIAYAIRVPAVSFYVGNIFHRAFLKQLWPLETAPIILLHGVYPDVLRNVI
jgi:hypothetical protein